LTEKQAILAYSSSEKKLNIKELKELCAFLGGVFF